MKPCVWLSLPQKKVQTEQRATGNPGWGAARPDIQIPEHEPVKQQKEGGAGVMKFNLR